MPITRSLPKVERAFNAIANPRHTRRANKIIFAPVYGYRYYVHSTSETSNFTLGTLTYIKALRQMLHEPRINGEIDSLLYGRYGTALASCIFKMIMSKNSKFEVYIKEYRRSLRSIGLKALGKSGLSLRQKCGIVYVLLPMTVCKLLTWIAKKFQRKWLLMKSSLRNM